MEAYTYERVGTYSVSPRSPSAIFDDLVQATMKRDGTDYGTAMITAAAENPDAVRLYDMEIIGGDAEASIYRDKSQRRIYSMSAADAGAALDKKIADLLAASGQEITYAEAFEQVCSNPANRALVQCYSQA